MDEFWEGNKEEIENIYKLHKCVCLNDINFYNFYYFFLLIDCTFSFRIDVRIVFSIFRINKKNASSILSIKYVDGALVGGASLKFSDFKAILDFCN